MKHGIKTYVYREGRGLVDVTDIVNAPPEPRVHLQTDSSYAGLAVPACEYGEKPGERARIVLRDISSRTKHRQYMQEKGLTHSSDFGARPDGSIARDSFWDRAAKRREELAAGTNTENNRRVREAAEAAVRKLNQGYRPGAPAPVDHEERFEVAPTVKTGDVVVS